ncbi:MAG: DUF4266 domain-containing protein [Methyloprofundus sp.]|uniref:DUF4266 domain-containing protein n=1 Tax=Methyloprofundus sp. TaxID=2020875 RepID=UPI00260FE69C|nr:DUF4266 domain-containing protein [Methyloprofundus sp.]
MIDNYPRLLMNITNPLKLVLSTILLLSSIACSSVAPWERGNLAKPHMAIDPHPMQNSLRGHAYGSREAAGAISAGGGGGCGCY